LYTSYIGYLSFSRLLLESLTQETHEIVTFNYSCERIKKNIVEIVTVELYFQ